MSNTQKRIDELTEELKNFKPQKKPQMNYEVVNVADMSMEEFLKYGDPRKEWARWRRRRAREIRSGRCNIRPKRNYETEKE